MLDLSFLCKSFCSQKIENLTGWFMFVETLCCPFIPLPQQTLCSHSQKFSYCYLQEGHMVPQGFHHLNRGCAHLPITSLKCVFLASPEAAAFATRLSIAELSWALPPLAQPPATGTAPPLCVSPAYVVTQSLTREVVALVSS